MSANQYNARQSYSIEAERAVLGSIIIDPKMTLPKLRELGLRPPEFDDPRNQTLLAAAYQIVDQEGLDEFTTDGLIRWLKDTNTLEQVGGFDYLSKVTELDCLKPDELAKTLVQLRGFEQLKIVSAGELINTDPPDIDPVVSDLFDLGDKVCIIAPSKTRKTFFLTQLAVAIASGIPFLNWEIPKPRRVLLVQLEVTHKHFHRRFKLVYEGMGSPDCCDRLGIVSGRGMDVPFSAIAEAAQRQKATVIAIDPIYKLQMGDENAASAWKPILAEFDRLATVTGAAVIYVHHDAKGHAGERQAQDRGSGSGIIGRDYDTAITITHHKLGDKLRVIEPIKRNYAPEKPFTVEWIEGVFKLSDEAAEVLTSKLSNMKSTSRVPLESFLDRVPECIAKSGRLVLNKGRMIDAIRTCTGLTKDRAGLLLDMAVEDGLIVTNYGKGLSRKQVLFATNEQHLSEEITRLKAEANGKQENLCLTMPKNKKRKTA